MIRGYRSRGAVCPHTEWPLQTFLPSASPGKSAVPEPQTSPCPAVLASVASSRGASALPSPCPAALASVDSSPGQSPGASAPPLCCDCLKALSSPYSPFAPDLRGIQPAGVEGRRQLNVSVEEYGWMSQLSCPPSVASTLATLQSLGLLLPPTTGSRAPGRPRNLIQWQLWGR